VNKQEREIYFFEQEEEALRGGASFSEWCTFISRSVYDAFVNGADLATIITAVTCIETCFITESPECKNRSLAQLIDAETFLSEEEKTQLHILRKYRNSWVHSDRIDVSELLENENKYQNELEDMALLSVRMLLIVLSSNPCV
jgi:hypothetical protein